MRRSLVILGATADETFGSVARLLVGGSIRADTREGAKAQAAGDFLIWATVAVTSLSSGPLLDYHGRHAVLTTEVPVLGLAAATTRAGSRCGTPPACSDPA